MARGAHILPDEWPVLLADAATDDRRLMAETHAADCALCAGTRRQAEDLLRAIDAQRPALAGADSLRSAVTSIEADLVRSSTRRALQERVAQKPALAPPPETALGGQIGLAVAAFALLVAGAHHRNTAFLPVAAALALLLLGTLVPPLLQRRPALVGWLALAAFPLPFLPMASWGFEVGHALACALSELLGAALPLGALAWLHVRRRVSWQPLTWAAAAFAGGLSAQGALELTCPSQAAGHVLVFHVLAVFVLAFAAAQVPRLLRTAPS